jgi:hypothetical protein
MNTTVKPYVWNLGKASATPGAMIRNARNNFIWIPMEDIISVSDALIDLVEQHEEN